MTNSVNLYANSNESGKCEVDTLCVPSVCLCAVSAQKCAAATAWRTEVIAAKVSFAATRP